MNSRQSRTDPEWLKYPTTRRLGIVAAMAVAACCAAVASGAMAAGDDAAPSSQSTVGTKFHDITLTAKVKAALLGTRDLSSGDIHVSTRLGKVVLTGSVPDEEQRMLAVNTAKQTEGVQGVRDRLTIRPN